MGNHQELHTPGHTLEQLAEPRDVGVVQRSIHLRARDALCEVEEVVRARVEEDQISEPFSFLNQATFLQFRVRARFVQKCTLTIPDAELVGVDLDFAVQDDVLPLDRADSGDKFGVEREVGCRGDA